MEQPQEFGILERNAAKGIGLLYDAFNEEMIIMFNTLEDEIETLKKINEFENISLEKRFDSKGSEYFILKSIYSEELYEILLGFNEINFANIFETLSDMFKVKKTPDYLKFRGDFGEVMFLHEFGGFKAPVEKLTYDIIYNDKPVEVKTCSSRNRIITVSHEQIEQDCDIYYVELKPSKKNGVSIIELANEISGSSEFVAKVIKKYSGTKFEYMKYSIVKPKILTNREKIFVKLPDFIRNAKYKIDIDLLEGNLL